MEELNEAENFSTAKRIKEFDTPQVYEMCGKLYLVAGKRKLFLLGEDSGENWARELSADEVDQLPVDIMWSGSDVRFEADSQKATELCKLTNTSN